MSLNLVTDDHRAEDLLLEDAHLVVAGEDGRLDVEALRQLAAQVGPLAAGQDLGALLLADVDVGEDLLQLVVGGLRADHGRRIERIALLDLLDALDGAFDELRRRSLSCNERA